MKKLTLLFVAAVMLSTGAFAEGKACCKKGGKCCKDKKECSKDSKSTTSTENKAAGKQATKKEANAPKS